MYSNSYLFSLYVSFYWLNILKQYDSVRTFLTWMTDNFVLFLCCHWILLNFDHFCTEQPFVGSCYLQNLNAWLKMLFCSNVNYVLLITIKRSLPTSRRSVRILRAACAYWRWVFSTNGRFSSNFFIAVWPANARSFKGAVSPTFSVTINSPKTYLFEWNR